MVALSRCCGQSGCLEDGRASAGHARLAWLAAALLGGVLSASGMFVQEQEKAHNGAFGNGLSQGREFDSHAGHYFFRNRIYFPEWGQFATPDMNLTLGPMGEAMGIGSYAFGGNSPLDTADPLGLGEVPFGATEGMWGNWLQRYARRINARSYFARKAILDEIDTGSETWVSGTISLSIHKYMLDPIPNLVAMAAQTEGDWLDDPMGESWRIVTGQMMSPLLGVPGAETQDAIGFVEGVSAAWGAGFRTGATTEERWHAISATEDVVALVAIMVAAAPKTQAQPGTTTIVKYDPIFASAQKGTISWPELFVVRQLPAGKVFSGHGGYLVGTQPVVTTVPEGTCLFVYSRFGTSILDSLGNAIELGRAVPTKVYLSGSPIPNLTLVPPTANLTLMGRPFTVARPTPIESLLQPGMGQCHWAACQPVVVRNVPPLSLP